MNKELLRNQFGSAQNAAALAQKHGAKISARLIHSWSDKIPPPWDAYFTCLAAHQSQNFDINAIARDIFKQDVL